MPKSHRFIPATNESRQLITFSKGVTKSHGQTELDQRDILLRIVFNSLSPASGQKIIMPSQHFSCIQEQPPELVNVTLWACDERPSLLRKGSHRCVAVRETCG